MGRKIKPYAATHWVFKHTIYGGETIYLKQVGSSWVYWNDQWFDWYYYDGDHGAPIKLI